MKVFQSRIWLVVGVVATLLFIGVLANPRFDFRSVELDELMLAIEAGNVKQIRVLNSTSVVALYLDDTKVRTTKPADFDILAEANVTEVSRAFLYVEDNNPLGAVFRAGALIILPLIAVTTFYIFYIGRVNAAKAEKSA